MHSISTTRFLTLAGYNLLPGITVTELGPCFSNKNEEFLAMCYESPALPTFGNIVLQKDDSERYQIIYKSSTFGSVTEVEENLETAVNRLAANPKPTSALGNPLDFFTPAVEESKLHSHFKEIVKHRRFSPARELISKLMLHYEDPDGNFVEQFQTTGFDARLWELYVYVALAEDGFIFDRRYDRPDFFAKSSKIEFFVEAVTANPSLDESGLIAEAGLPDDDEELKKYLSEYVPIKYGRSLCSKLKKKYWQLAHVTGKPLVIAIQDFHVQGSMSYSAGHLANYLYGLRHEADVDADGQLSINASKIEEHIWGTKSIKSGFFNMPGCQNISAIITNANATINKFNRIGYGAGFGDRDIGMVRGGTYINHDTNAQKPLIFEHEVTENYFEPWGEGMNVYHNPKAKYPIPKDILRFAAHHRLIGEQIASSSPDFHPIASFTAYGVKKT